MTTVIVFLALISAAAVQCFPTDVQNVPVQCRDPTFACQDLKNARACHVIKSCANDIWSAMRAPDDNDDICQICKEMVKEARDQLLSNMTQEEIKEVFEGSCKLLPVKLIANACIKLVDEFIPDLVEMLASRMDPNMVCTVSGLCNLAHLPIKDSKVCDDLTCEFCTNVLQHIKDLVTANTTVEEFRTALQNFCKHTGSFSEKCTDIVNEYFDVLFSFIKNMNSKTVCTLLDLCGNSKCSKHKIPMVRIMPALQTLSRIRSSKLVPGKLMIKDENSVIQPFVKIEPAESVSKIGKHNIENEETNEIFGSSENHQLPGSRLDHPLLSFGSDVDCAFCKAITFYLKADLKDDHQEASVTNAVDVVCTKWVTEYPDYCKAFLQKYASALKSEIVKNANYVHVCSNMKICPLENDGNGINVVVNENTSTLCEMCKETFDEIESQLKDPSTKKAVQNYLDATCNYLPQSLQQSCTDFINQNVDNLFNILEQELTGDNVCPALHLCPGYFRMHASRRGNNLECELCKQFVEQLEKQLQDPATKASLKALIERGCTFLPKEISAECKTFVDNNVDKLIDVLVQDMNPGLICSALNFCPSAKWLPALHLHLTQALKTGNDLECDLCKEIVSKVDDELKDQKTEEAIKEALDKVCSYLPSSWSTKCKNFIDKYSQMLISILAEEMDPTMVCSAIDVCKAEEKMLMKWKSKGVQLKCEGCHYVFHFIQEQLMNSDVQEMIKNEVNNVCRLLPGVYGENCVAFVKEYGDSLLVLIAQEMDPSSACVDIGACKNTTSQAKQIQHLNRSDKTLNIDKCSLCTTVIDYLSKLLQEDDLDKEITAVVEKVCSVVPSSVKDKCQVMVETYSPYILQMIGQLMNSKEICQEIDMCDHPTGHAHLLGGDKCTFGPSYWCQSHFHASACKAETYCKQNVWLN